MHHAIPAAVLLVAIPVQPTCDDNVSVPMHVRTVWTVPADAEARTIGCIATNVAFDPATGEAYADTAAAFACDPDDLRHEFSLEDDEVLLGEPVIVRLVTSLHGDGTHDVVAGGNYRARGRDDNFLFLARHDDGTWVADPYAPIEYYMGGLSTAYTVTQDEPLEQHLALQQWCGIDRPGTYDIYCFCAPQNWDVLGDLDAIRAALPPDIAEAFDVGDDRYLVDRATGERVERYAVPSWVHDPDPTPSPIAAHIPLDVLTHADATWGASQATIYAHLTLRVRQGTPRETAEMAARWTAISGGEDSGAMHTYRAAVTHAIRHLPQGDFLALLERWLDDDDEAKRLWAKQGLAMNPDPRATDILIAHGPDVVSALYHMPEDRQEAFIPHLIEWLTHEDSNTRARCESWLSTWTGQSFEKPWPGYDASRPTPEEAAVMQAAWRTWWSENGPIADG